DDRIVFFTIGYRLVELNAKTGQPVATFGKNGMVDLKEGVVIGKDKPIDLERGEIGIHSTPTVVTDTIIVASSMAEGPGRRYRLDAETLVAVDLKTGTKKWHFQLVHHPIWDHDISSAPLLIDATINGRPRKLVAQPTKQSFLYVFDRITGEPIWPMPEKSVPQT